MLLLSAYGLMGSPCQCIVQASVSKPLATFTVTSSPWQTTIEFAGTLKTCSSTSAIRVTSLGFPSPKHLELKKSYCNVFYSFDKNWNPALNSKDIKTGIVLSIGDFLCVIKNVSYLQQERFCELKKESFICVKSKDLS